MKKINKLKILIFLPSIFSVALTSCGLPAISPFRRVGKLESMQLKCISGAPGYYQNPIIKDTTSINKMIESFNKLNYTNSARCKCMSDLSIDMINKNGNIFNYDGYRFNGSEIHVKEWQKYHDIFWEGFEVAFEDSIKPFEKESISLNASTITINDLEHGTQPAVYDDYLSEFNRFFYLKTYSSELPQKNKNNYSVVVEFKDGKKIEYDGYIVNTYSNDVLEKTEICTMVCIDNYNSYLGYKLGLKQQKTNVLY